MSSTIDEVLDAVEGAQSAAVPSERERRIVHNFQAWEAAKKVLREERKQANENVQAKAANLRAAVEQGVDPKDVSGQINKLQTITVAWQDLTEAKEERTERVKLAREVVTTTEQRLREAVEKSHQLSLFADESAPSES